MAYRILLLGASGQLGWELARSLLPLGVIVSPDRAQCDLARCGSAAALIEGMRPDVIVNAAAYTQVDRAEGDEKMALAINADVVGEIARSARSLGALLVHFSTEYVFDGSKRAPYVEEDQAEPLNAYGRSKLQGERAIRDSGADHLIFRTSWLYSSRGSNFLLTILKLASEREELRVVEDQIGAPTWTRLVADTTTLAIHRESARRGSGTFESSTLNLSAAGETSRHGFAATILELARERGAVFKTSRLIPIPTREYPTPAKRPANSRLSLARLTSRYGLEMPGWESCLPLCLSELYPQAGVGNR